MLVFKEECIDDVIHEIKELLTLHRDELSIFDSTKYEISPYFGVYYTLEREGNLSITTARTEGDTLVGYAIYFITPHLHYTGIRNADADIYFLHKDYRKGLAGVKLLKSAEKNVKARGATHITQKCKTHVDLSDLFTRMGYSAIEKVFIKEL